MESLNAQGFQMESLNAQGFQMESLNAQGFQMESLNAQGLAWWSYSLHFRWYINTPSHYKDTGVLPNSVARSTTLQLLHNANLIDRVKRRKPVQNANIQNMHPVFSKAIHFVSCIQSVTFGANPIQHITEYHSIFSSIVVAASCYACNC
jgi:hypothetical protein